MALKRRSSRMEQFSMASMTDIIFLLLIFFMVLSTLIVPNSIKVNLPSSSSTAPSEEPLARITIDSEGLYYLQLGKEQPQMVDLVMLQEQLEIASSARNAPAYVALYADETVPYRDIVAVLNLSSSLDINLVLATKALRSN